MTKEHSSLKRRINIFRMSQRINKQYQDCRSKEVKEK